MVGQEGSLTVILSTDRPGRLCVKTAADPSGPSSGSLRWKIETERVDGAPASRASGHTETVQVRDRSSRDD